MLTPRSRRRLTAVVYAASGVRRCGSSSPLRLALWARQVLQDLLRVGLRIVAAELGRPHQARVIAAARCPATRVPANMVNENPGSVP
jgi:hypothetical protein